MAEVVNSNTINRFDSCVTNIFIKMQVITPIINFVFSNVTTFTTCLVIGWLTYKLSKFYGRAWSLPPGPTPLPVLGNILTLRGKKCNNAITLGEMSKKYGPVFTFWGGNNPFVFITDLELSKEAIKKTEFAGRQIFSFIERLFGNNSERSDIFFDQFGHRWESNRRVAHAAVRKYAVSDKLATLVYEVVDETVKDMFKEGVNKPFIPDDYIRQVFLVILASSAFGRRYTTEDPELDLVLGLQKSLEDPRFTILELVPFLRVFQKSVYDKVNNDFLKLRSFLDKKFDEHLKDFDENQIRDFCDALLLARQEAIAEAKETAQYLTTENLGLAIFDLFLAGSSTTQATTRWILLFMANYPEYQRKMSEEIASVIGDRMPVQEDRNNCNFTNAFLHEVLRLRPVAPISVAHRTMVDAKIGDYVIPENTAVMQHIYAIQLDSNNFPEPEKFKPERFLDETGRFLSQKPAGFIPFGSGRRVCLGEKMAIADMFLVIANLLIKINGYELAMEKGPGSAELEMGPNLDGACFPVSQKIMLKKK